MADEKLTTIQILESDSERIDALKIHEKQPAREIMTMLLDAYEETAKKARR